MAQARDEAGNIWEVDAQGNAVRLVQAAGSPPPQQKGTVYTPPPTPKAPREAPSGYRWDANGNLQVIPGGPADKPDPSAPGSTPDVTAKIRSDALGQFNGARMLNQAQSTMVDAYKKGPGKTSGIYGLSDMLPGWMSERNQNFNKDAEAGRGMVVQGLGLTGGSVNSMAEAQMWTGPYTPSASDYDSTTRNSIDRLAPLRESAARDSVSVLGGVPDLDGTIHPIGSPRANQILASIGLTPDLKAMPNVWDQPSPERPANQAMEGSLLGAGKAVIGQGRMREQNDPETAARAKQAWLSGASYDQVNQIFKDAGYPGISIEEFNAVEPWRKKGRGKEVSWVTAREVPMSPAEELAGSPTGAVLAGIANAGSFGGVQRLAPEQMQAIQALNPPFALGGEVLGSIGGTAMLGKLGSGAAKKFAPELGEQVSNRLMQAFPKLKPETIGRMGGTARGIGTDAAYAGIYGANTGQDPLESMVRGAGGSVLGRTVGSATGKFLGGIGGTSMREISDAGVTMTPGQLARASLEDTPSRFGVRKMIAGLEDSVANTPVLNASVGSARQRSFEQGNQAMFREAAGGAPIDNFGPQALEDLYQMKNRAYDDAAQGVSIPLDDPRLIQQLGDANQYGLGQDFARGRKDFATSMDQSFAPILGDGPNINGRQLQDSLRYTQGEQRVWNQAAGGAAPDPSARGIGNAFGKVNDAMVSAAARNAPGAIPKLKIANRLNRNLSVMDNATGAAAAEGGLASPMQVINAIKSNNSKFGAGRGQRALEKSPLYQTAAKLQAILPNKAPPTGVNAAPMLAILGAGAAGTGQATDSSSLSGLGGLLLASLAYTKLGSKGLNAALIKRPKALKALGSEVSERKGLFGAASVPLMLESGN